MGNECRLFMREGGMTPSLSLSTPEVSMKSDGSACKHDDRLQIRIHGGGDMVASFEGQHIGIDAEACLTCGLVMMRIKYPALLQAFINERDKDRRQT